MSAMVGMKFGVNMLKADPKLWVPVSNKYNGFAFTPSKGWLSNADTKTPTKYNRRSNKGQSTIHSMSSTATDVRTKTKLWCTETVEKIKR